VFELHTACATGSQEIREDLTRELRFNPVWGEVHYTGLSPQFSDVIALAGTSGLPAAFRTPHDLSDVANKVTTRSPLN
jgi:hypothetical protein